MATTKATLLGHRSASSFSDLTLSGDLTVSGTTTTIDTDVVVSDSTVINNAGSDVGLKINSTSSGHIMQLQDNGTDTVIVADGGNVGIGASPLATHSDSVSMRFGGLGNIISHKASTANKSLNISNNVQLDTDGSYEYIIDDEASLYSQYGGAHRFYTAVSGTATNDITFKTPLQLFSDGNATIGGISAGEQLTLDGGSGVDSGYIGWRGNGAHIGFIGGGAGLGASAGDFVVRGQSNIKLNIGGGTKAILDSSGNVGIGTTSPVGNLHLSESGATEVRFQMTNSNTGQAASDGFGIVLNAAASHQYFWNYESRDIIFGTSNTTYLTIGSDGKMYAPGLGSETGHTALGWRSSDSQILKLTSSKRFKSDIANTTFDSSKINSLKCRDFTWTETGNKYIGLIAEEVHEFIPKAVAMGIEDGEPVCESVDYHTLTALLIDYSQKLEQRITALENA